MANHCIDATCIECGTQWCLLNCGYEQVKDEKPDVTGKQVFDLEVGEKCPKCKGVKVVYGS